MVSLLELAPQTETVSVGGKNVDVFGISLEGVVKLLNRFPALQKVAMGNKLTPKEIIEIAPEAVGAIIAMGCGVSGENGEIVANQLAVEIQMDFLTAIGRLTMPSGLRPFIAKLEALYLKSGVPSKVPATKSPSPSKSSLAPVIPLATSGV